MKTIYFFHSPQASYDGMVSYNEELDLYGVYLKEGDIILSARLLFVIETNEETGIIAD